MGRWTENTEELEHLQKIINQIDPSNGTVVLKDGRRLYGIILPSGITNDPKTGKSNADIIVRVKIKENQFEDHKLDVLDIIEITPGRLN